MISRLLKLQNGLTVLETLISISMMSIAIIIVITAGAINGTRTNTQTEDVMVAAEALKDNMEYITGMDFASIKTTYPEGYEEILYSLQSKSGKWRVNYPSTGNPNLLCIRLTARWLDSNGIERSIELLTLKS